MRLTRKRGIALMIGVAVFLAAFGIAFAAIWTQASQQVASELKVQGTIVISGDEVFRLWRDKNMTQPLISGDGPHLFFTKVETKPPLRNLKFVFSMRPIIENISNTFVRPIDPCQDVSIGGAVVGHVSAGLERLGEGDFERGMGGTCDDGFRGRMMAPGEKWRMHLNFNLNQPLAEGSHFFDVFFGVVGVTGDALAGP